MTVTGPVQLDVSVDSGCVRVRRGEEGSVTVRGWASAHSSIFSFRDPRREAEEIASNPPLWQDGNQIKIGDLDDPRLLRHIELLLEISAPADTRVRAFGDSADLQIVDVNGPVYCEADSGEIEITGIETEASASCDSGSILISKVKGPVTAHADSGGIQISEAGASVRATCDSGSIAIFQAAGPVDAQTDSGGIQAIQIGGEVRARADSGSIDVSLTSAAPVQAEADSGSITVRLADSGYNLRLRTDNGRISVPETFRVQGEFDGAIRGGGPLVQVETDSGSIEITY